MSDELYKKVKRKNVAVKHAAEIGVYYPETSNIYKFIEDGIRCTLVEPDPVSIERIKAYLVGKENVTLFPYAICDFNGIVDMYQCTASTFVGHLTRTPVIVNDGYSVLARDKFVAQARTVDSVDDGSIDLLSIDTEGSEWFVIQNLISRPLIISLETHGGLYKNAYISEIKAWMAHNHYVLWYKEKSDSVYVKNGIILITILDRMKLCLTEIYLIVKIASVFLMQFRLFKKMKILVKWVKIVRNWPLLIGVKTGIWKKNFEVILRNGLKLHLLNRGQNGRDSDLVVLGDIYFNTPYTQHPIRLSPGDVVVDIGANVGVFSTFLTTVASPLRIFSYEPSSENYRMLSKNIAENHLESQIQAFQSAVSSQNGVQALYLNARGSGGNSLFESSVSETFSGQEVVSVVTLEGIFDKNGLSQIDFLKLDCEGAEWEILMYSSLSTLSKVKQIAFEWHDVPGHSLEILMMHLKKIGFSISSPEPHIVYAIFQK